MCEYCKNDGYYKANKSLISKTLKNNVDIDLSINVKDKKLVASIENLTMSLEDDNWFLPTKKINFCPMCRTKTSRRWTKKWTKGGQAMTKEEEKAIEIVAKYLNFNEICGTRNFKEALETVLSMLKEKDTEIEKKDKIIDLITEFLGERDLGYYENETGGEILGIMRKYNKEDWKEYFENKLNGPEQN